MTPAVELKPEERRLLEDTAERIVAARMAVPAMMFLVILIPIGLAPPLLSWLKTKQAR